MDITSYPDDFLSPTTKEADPPLAPPDPDPAPTADPDATSDASSLPPPSAVAPPAPVKFEKPKPARPSKPSPFVKSQSQPLLAQALLTQDGSAKEEAESVALASVGGTVDEKKTFSRTTSKEELVSLGLKPKSKTTSIASLSSVLSTGSSTSTGSESDPNLKNAEPVPALPPPGGEEAQPAEEATPPKKKRFEELAKAIENRPMGSFAVKLPPDASDKGAGEEAPANDEEAGGTLTDMMEAGKKTLNRIMNIAKKDKDPKEKEPKEKEAKEVKEPKEKEAKEKDDSPSAAEKIRTLR